MHDDWENCDYGISSEQLTDYQELLEKEMKECYSYTPTEKEKQIIIFAMEEYTQDNYGENILEFIMSEKEEETLSMGGI